MTDFNFRAHVTHYLQQTDLTDPQQIAQTILKDLTHQQIHQALLDLLPNYIKAIYGLTSASARRSPTNDSSNDSTPNTTQQPQSTNRQTPTLPQRISQYCERVRNSKVRDATGTYRLFNEFTLTDVRFAADYRYQKASEITHHAKRFEKLAARMEELDITTLAELSDADLESSFGHELPTTPDEITP